MKTRILFGLFGLLFIGAATAADMTIYYSPTCPHCHHMRDYASNNFIYEYPSMKITMVDVTVPENRSLFIDVIKTCEYESGGVPVIKIGDKCFQGFAESMADDMRAAIESDMDAAAKQSAADVKRAISENGDTYRQEHPTPVATISEYTAQHDETAEKKTTASDNKWASWVLIVLALVVLGFSVSVAKGKSKK
ncbi:MAG: hypothetical protein MJ164_02405 [Alphaproteobacteria bacterium]|nr:hypothetical protein [Alphaproteobacteria bacterium]